MDSHSILTLLLLILLVAFSAFFSSSETALSSASRIRMKNYANSSSKKSRGARMALKLMEEFDRTISTILIGNNIVNILATSIATVFFTDLLGPAGVAVSTVVLTIVILIFGEVLPKSIAKDYAESYSVSIAGPMSLLVKLFLPLSFLLSKMKGLVVRGRDEEGEAAPSVTEEELKYIIEEIEDEGVLEQQESELVQSALEFDEITVEEILTPRVDIQAIDLSSGPEAALQFFQKHHYSRLPVYEKTIDHIVGIIHERDFYRSYLRNPQFDLRNVIKQPVYVPPTVRISNLMAQLQKGKTHMAIVTDQYGGTMGLITLEDVLEELVGDIWDESDEVSYEMKALDDHTYAVSADMNVHDFFEQLECAYNEDEVESNTVGGWFTDELGRIPEEGDTVETSSFIASVRTMDEKRVKEIIVTMRGTLPTEEQ